METMPWRLLHSRRWILLKLHVDQEFKIMLEMIDRAYH
jgi:hypothetical protein